MGFYYPSIDEFQPYTEVSTRVKCSRSSII